LPGSPCHCRCYGVAPHSVSAAAFAAVSLPSARHTGAARSNSNTPPLLVLRTKQKSTKSRTVHQILVDLIKTSAVKTSWEKHLLVGKRVPTYACRQDARTCFNKRNLLSSSNSLSPAPPFLCQRTAPPFPFRDRPHSSYSDSPLSGPNGVRLVSSNSCSCRGTARGFINRSAGLDSEVTYWNLTAPFICSS